MKKLIGAAIFFTMVLCASSAYATLDWYECDIVNAGENMAIGSAVVDVKSSDGSFSGGRALSLASYTEATINRSMAAVLTAVSAGKTIMVAFDPDEGSIVVPLAIYVRP